MAPRAVFFDVGETILDETRLWTEWADWLGVPPFTLFAVMGAGIERGEHPVGALRQLQPGFDLARELAAREDAGQPSRLLPGDLYPDALPCLQALRERGYVVGVAGNQDADLEQSLRDLDLPADVVTSAASLGVAKPSPEFFVRLASAAGVDPAEAVHVGDRVDNDVVPAREAGMMAVLIRRGPWAHLQGGGSQRVQPNLRIESLDELPDALDRLR
jgi:HAD superfamily hydrolase (TIGR01509 family)